ncbi:MAG: LamG domain-containing protein, partial [Methanomicrobiales archaeon]|nr:LamG domain-containing protein [Methanomicrobiales archaeon]
WFSRQKIRQGGNLVELRAGTYWLAWQWNSPYLGPSSTTGSSGDGYYLAQSYGAFPSPWSGGTSSSEKWTMYMTYRSVKIGARNTNWHYLTVTRTGTGENGLTTYYDGAPVITATDSRTLTNTYGFTLAASGAYTNGFTGYLDEVRLSNAARSSDWIKTEYNNQNNPSTFHYPMAQESYSCSAGGSGSLNVQVGASTDDTARFALSSFSPGMTIDWVDVTNAGTDNVSSGVRFTGVTVPQGATITKAYITYRADQTRATPGSGKIYGQAADDAATFSTYTDYDSRTRTSTYVTWAPSAWVAGTDYNSTEIKTVIQEIVNRPGWTSGNSMVLFLVPSIVGSASGYSYDGSATYAPKLHIEYATSPQSVDVQVAASTDDCQRWDGNLFTNLVLDWLDTIYYNNPSSGSRFTGVNVPKGATITNAYLTYRAAATQPTPGSGKIYGQAADNPITFSTLDDYDARTRTTAYVQWAPSAWVADTDYASPDIKTVIQEIVNRPGWASGNSLVLFVVGDHANEGAGISYDWSPTYAPKLHIEYTT